MPRPLQATLSADPAVVVDSRLDYSDTYAPVFGADCGLDLAADYECGDLLTFRTAALGMSDEDWDFVNAIKPKPSDSNFYKKAKLRSLLAPVEKKSYDKHVLAHFFPGDTGKALRLQGLITAVNARLRKHVQAAFPGYVFTGESITWRLTATEAEEMHFDSYGTEADDRHHVRLFVNLDDKPRLWGVSHDVLDMIDLYPDRARPHAHLAPNIFNGAFTKALPWPEVPRHFVAFAPGNAWLVNSQLASHEIIWGRKMIACTFDVDPTSMLDPSKNFATAVAAKLKELDRA